MNRSVSIIAAAHPIAISNKNSEPYYKLTNLRYNDTASIPNPINRIIIDDIVQQNYSPVNVICL